MKSIKRILVSLPLLLLLLTTGCSNNADFLVPASPISAREARLFWILLILGAIVFIVVEGLLLYNITYHAKEPGDREIPPQHYRETTIEAIYTGIPILLVIVIFILMLSTMRAVAAPAPQSSDLKLTIIGHRWWWEFDYPDLGIKTANELVIPVNTTVQVELRSFDVIHSFYVPQLSGKTDVIPGIDNHMWLLGDRIGKFHGQCSEYCGENHANMRITVFVESQDDFKAWVAGQQKPVVEPQTAMQKEGQDIIINGVCGACHDLGDEGPENPTGPNLTHLMSRSTFAGGILDTNEANLRRWLEDTQAVKPGNDMNHKFSQEQIDALIAYLVTLK